MCCCLVASFSVVTRTVTLHVVGRFFIYDTPREKTGKNKVWGYKESKYGRLTVEM